MSIWLCIVFITQTGRMLYCLMDNIDLTLTRHHHSLAHRTYVILFDPWTMCRSYSASSSPSHRTYVILFNFRMMSFWLCLIIAAPSGRMLYCLMRTMLMWCDSLPLPQNVCYLVWSLENLDLILPRHRRSNRRYIILFDPWTISIWLFLVITAPTEGILSRLKPGQFRSDSSSSAHSYRTYVILLNLIPGQCWYISLYRPPRTYVILFDFWTMSLWLYLVIAAQAGRMLYCLIPGQCQFWLCLVLLPPPSRRSRLMPELCWCEFTMLFYQSYGSCVIYFDSSTMIRPFLIFSASTECTWSCLLLYAMLVQPPRKQWNQPKQPEGFRNFKLWFFKFCLY